MLKLQSKINVQSNVQSVVVVCVHDIAYQVGILPVGIAPLITIRMLSIAQAVKVCNTIFDSSIRLMDQLCSTVMILIFQIDYSFIGVQWHCKFFGRAPYCNGKCGDGYEEIFKSAGYRGNFFLMDWLKNDFGDVCKLGTKKAYCCKKGKKLLLNNINY